MSQVILITGACSGFGAMSARALADAGHIVYASMRDSAGRNAPQAEHNDGLNRGLGRAEVAMKNLAACEPLDADPTSVARAIVDVVNAPFGHRPFRVHIDPSDDGCAVVAAVADRVRAEFLRRIQLGGLLSPRVHPEVSNGG